MPPAPTQNGKREAVEQACSCEAKRRMAAEVMATTEEGDVTVASNWVSGPLSDDDRESIDRFRELVRIPSISGEGVSNGSYAQCAALLQKWLAEIPRVTNIRSIEYVPGKPVVLATFPGTEPTLKSILLNGHYDVVPVFRQHWETDPFEAVIKDGKIYGRGTQDMKCVLSGYIEGLRHVFADGRQLRRTIHVSLVPDEEVGGVDGAGKFVESPEFAEFNVGVVLDEGLATPSAGNYTLFYGERSTNWVTFRVKGNTGHGSRFIENTAVEKLVKILSKIYAVRAEQRKILDDATCGPAAAAKTLGDVLTVNVTALQTGVPSSSTKSGFALNVIPSEALIGLDVRVPLHIDTSRLQGIFDDWLGEYKDDVEVQYDNFSKHPPALSLSDPWLLALRKAIQDAAGVQTNLEIFPSGTDSRYFREKGLPCFGFSPMRDTPILLHDHNEFITEKALIEGIRVYTKIIPVLANLEHHEALS
ncbi:adenylate cyclase [Perkinsus chesapeaki]|uniref:N-acyl-aliphatic-L-amino acid amidohydrolase n=1 Tax=Perkinsus chesapeaki TaxID=330153 RepID=A0A7J6LP04_PERCH|nr:adenylate cyclase [Perkinsus chesapeaki]